MIKNLLILMPVAFSLSFLLMSLLNVSGLELERFTYNEMLSMTTHLFFRVYVVLSLCLAVVSCIFVDRHE